MIIITKPPPWRRKSREQCLCMNVKDAVEPLQRRGLTSHKKKETALEGKPLL